LNVPFSHQVSTRYSGIELHSLAHLWRASADAGLPVAAAAVLGVTPEEAEEWLWTGLNEEAPEEPVGAEGEPPAG
jgi:hypothetical protein